MKRRPETWRRWFAASGLCLVAFLLGGCVYLRLLVLKRQFAEFDRNFTLQTQEGLRLTCLKPVLLSEDLRWLGIFPEAVTKHGRSEQWRVHWVKQVSSDQPEPAAHDLELELHFSENKFVGFFITERYFAFIPKGFVTRTLHGLGTASVDRGKRSVYAAIAPSTSNPVEARPTLESLTALLGSPTEQHREGSLTLRRDHFLPPTPSSNDGDFDLLFTFDTATRALLRLEARSPVGRISLDFGTPATAGSPASAPVPPAR